MDKMMQLLTMFAQGTQGLMASVPVLSTGKAGNILGLIFMAEEAALGILQSHAAQKEAAAAPAPPPANINAIPTA